MSEKRRARDLPFDLRPVPRASTADFDLDFFREDYLPAAISEDVLAENRRSTTQQLQSLRLLSTGDPPEPTVLGLLVLGRQPRDFLPGAYIQFLRIAGSVLTDPIKGQKEIDGAITDLLGKVDDVLEAHNNVASDFVSRSTEIKKPTYPIVALQQIVRNAVLHRTYEGTHAPIRIYWFDDRIEILSPGGPYGNVTIRNFGQPHLTDYRNPNLAAAMKELGFIQKFGAGLPTAQAELSKNGNPPLELEPQDEFVLVTVQKATE